MSRWYNQDSDHIVAKLLRRKGYTEFEYGGSQIKNQYSGWWSESDKHPELSCRYLEETLKDVVWMLRNTNEIPDLNQKN